MFIIDQTLGWSWQDQRLTIDTPVATVQLSPLAGDLIRFRITAGGAALVLPTEAVVKTDWAPVQATVTEEEGRLILRAGRMRVEIDLSPLRLSWYEGEHLFAIDQEIQIDRSQVMVRRRLPPTERFYGLGEKTGFLDRRGRRYTMWNTDEPLHTEDKDPLYQTIPFLIGLSGFHEGRAHGLFVDSTARSHWDLGSMDPTDTYSIHLLSPVYDAYVFAGPSMGSLIGRYTELTGRIELPPLWTLGYHQCRWSYYPQERVEWLARNFRERGIPCDGLWLDIDYMDGYRVFTWDRERFPQPARLISDLAERGFKTVVIVDPGVKVDPDYPVYNEGAANGYFMTNPDGSIHVGKVWPGEAAFPDFHQPAVRQWWGDQHQAAYYDQGIAGIWNDMNEPASFLPNAHGENTVPHDLLQGEAGRQVPHKEVHNAYGFQMGRATHEGWKRLRPEKRPFILTRSGYAGIQRYAAVWLGDNHSWWSHLLAAIPMCMNMGLSGVPFVGTDVGGFSSNPTGELIARWIQLGAFTPFFRMHSVMMSRDQEPWSFGPEVEEICRRYITLRYRLLPLFYSLFDEARRTGLPVMRPLVLQYQDDPETYRIHDQVLLGRDLMIAPLYQPGASHRPVYLPEGVWHDFWTGEEHEGRRWILAKGDIETLPAFVRGGGVLPMVPAMNYVGERPVETLTLHIYPGEGSFDLYDDAGEGYGYTRGEFARTRITVDVGRVIVGSPAGGYRPTWQQVEVILHGVPGQITDDAAITVDGEPVTTQPGGDGAVRFVVPRPGGFTVDLAVRLS